MRKRKRSIWEYSCILGLPQLLTFLLFSTIIALRWRSMNSYDDFDSWKLIVGATSFFWFCVILRNLIWIKTSKPIGFFTFLDTYKNEPIEISDKKRRSQYPDIPHELLSDIPDGLVLGKKGKKYVRVKLQRGNILNAIILGSAGCGKSVLLLTMLIFQLHLHELKKSMCIKEDVEPMTFYVTDIKPELGRKSIVLFPENDEEDKVHYMDVTNRSFYGWDVFFALNADSSDDEILAELDIIARALIDEGKAEKNAFFYQHARIIFKAILLYQWKTGRSFIQGLDYLMTGRLLDVIGKTMEKIEGKPEYKLIVKLLSPYIGKEGEAFQGIELAFRQQLDIFNQQAVQYFLEGNPRKASYHDLENKVSVIFGIQESKLEEYRSLLRLVTMQIKEHSIRRPESSHMLTYLIDEAARIGIDWTSFLATSRSRQICTILAFQSISQAEDKWGKEKTKSLLELCRIIAVLSCTDPDMAKMLGEWVGDYAEEKHSITHGSRGNGSSSTSYEDKKILTQADIMQLQDNKEVIAFIKGIYLRMHVDGARYYNIPILNQISEECVKKNDYLAGGNDYE